MPVILMYHRIGMEHTDPFGLCVHPYSFAAHMRHLRTAYQPVALAVLVDHLVAGDSREREVAVTFDDGYLDNLTVAAPILAQWSIPATFFLTTEAIDQVREYWWDTLTRLV